jgi:hypothetical protein
MSESADAGEVYYFLTLVDRVAGDDSSIRRRVDALSAEERAVVARKVVEYANGTDNDEMGRHLVKEALRRELRL